MSLKNALLGREVTKRLSRLPLSSYHIADSLREYLGFGSTSSTLAYLFDVRQGYITKTRGRPATPLTLERLSTLLYALGFDENDTLINSLVERCLEFSYPPEDKNKPELPSPLEVKIRTYAPLGEKVKTRMRQLNLKRKTIADLAYEYLELGSSATALIYLSHISQGQIYGNRYGGSLFLPKKPRSKDIPQRLRRLSKLLYLLEFDKNDSLIKNLVEKVPGFEYPPKDTKKPKIQSNA